MSQQQTEEEILIVDDGVGYLRDSEALLPTLKLPIHHVTAEEMQTSTGLVGVPMLLITRADGTIAYAGGYGEGSHQDVRILKELQEGRGVSKKTVVGCAVGRRLKRRMDPFHLKYETVAQSAMAR